MESLGEAIKKMGLPETQETDMQAAMSYREKMDQFFADGWKRKQRQRYYQASLWGQTTARDTFTFDDWVPAKQANQALASQYKTLAMGFTKQLQSDTFNVAFIGRPGTGKTALALAMFAALRESKSVMFVSAVMLKQVEFGPIERRDERAVKLRDDTERAMAEVDVLLIDDFGKEVAKENTVVNQYLFRLADARQGKTTIITSNYSVAQLEQRYDAAVVDRLISKKRRLVFDEFESVREV